MLILDEVRGGFAFLCGYRAFQHLAIQVEADSADVPVLFPAKQIAGPAQFQIECGNAEARSQVAELPQRRQPFAGQRGLSPGPRPPAGRTRR